MIREANPADLDGILEIYNDAVVNTTAVYDYRAQTMEERLNWYRKKAEEGFPVLVFEQDQTVVGFASFGSFRPWPAYKYTVEHSIYVHPLHRGKGIGKRLLEELITIADMRGYATMVAGIDAQNEASCRLHESMGFAVSGIIRRAGYKFGRWLDLVFYQIDLTGPAAPEEG